MSQWDPETQRDSSDAARRSAELFQDTAQTVVIGRSIIIGIAVPMSNSRKSALSVAFASALLLFCSSAIIAQESPELGIGRHSDQHQADFDGSEEYARFPYGGPYGGFEDIINEDEEVAVDVSHLDVAVLTAANFSRFVLENHYVMVEFYAPWCGHCKALAPEFAAAATELKPTGVFLAKVDATEESELAQQYDVHGYPTILFFTDGKPKPYSQLRNRESIVSWIKKRTSPAVTELTAVSDAQHALRSGSTIVVAFFDELEGPEVEAFELASTQEDEVVFYRTRSREIADMFHIKHDVVPALVLMKNMSEKVVHYDGLFESAILSEFIAAHKLPLVIPFTRETSSSILQSTIKKQLILFASPEDAESVMAEFEEASRSFKGKIIFVHVDPTDQEVGKPVVEFFGVTGSKPEIIAFHAAPERPIKYLFEDEITADKIKSFVTDFLDKRLKEFFKSQPIPVTNDEDVKVVVGKNFDEIVLDESKDVLLEIYAPWCGHCQALEPIYDKLARVLRDVDSLVIAKMDGTVNEHPRGRPDGFPTLLFFPAGRKSFDPITVDTDRTVKAFYRFLKKNAAIPFTVPKTKKAGDGKVSSDILVSEPERKPVHDIKDEL